MDNSMITDLVVKTADVMIKNTTETIFNRIDAAKGNRDREKTILALEEIIKDLLDDKNKLNQIIRRYEELLAIQKLSNENIDYITENIVPLLSQILTSDTITKGNEEKAEEINEFMTLLTPLLSVETLTILQLLGFNFREGIGIPLTNLVKETINKKEIEQLNYHYNIEATKTQGELFKLLQTQEGRDAYQSIVQK
ncbi:MAG: hypothetical protein GX666_03260 [Tissierellia bacterium]|nr:hypothetical protein [Tissierellia bacterium]